MLIISRYIHLLSIVVWIGSIVFFSFIGAPAIFRTLDRQAAGDVVGAIFPKYFMLWQVCSVLSILTLLHVGFVTGFSSSVKVGLVILALMGGITAYSSLVNGPQAREVKTQIRTETDEVKKEELKKKFGRLHGISMVLNIATLILGLVLIYFVIRYLPAS